MPETESTRCPWCGSAEDYVAYHDRVWGRPVSDSRELFAKLCLDGQQAGLSWITILRKQANYERIFHGLDPQRCAAMTDDDLETALQDPGIVRNRLKVFSIRRNALAYMRIESEQPFNQFLWSFVGGSPIQNRFSRFDQVPTQTPESEAMSKALKKAGFTFVGPTIVYAFMQAVGMVNDHLAGCPQYEVCQHLGETFVLT